MSNQQLVSKKGAVINILKLIMLPAVFALCFLLLYVTLLLKLSPYLSNLNTRVIILFTTIVCIILFNYFFFRKVSYSQKATLIASVVGFVLSLPLYVMVLITIIVYKNTDLVDSLTSHFEINVPAIVSAFEAGKYEEASGMLGKLSDLSPEEFKTWTSTEKPLYLPPPLLLELGKIAFNFDKNDSVKWSLLGQVQLQYDAKKCADETAASGVSILNSQYIEQLAYLISQPQQSLYTLETVIELDKTAKPNIDKHGTEPRYICSHGIKAFSGKIEYVDKNQWDELREQTYQEIRASLMQRWVKNAWTEVNILE